MIRQVEPHGRTVVAILKPEEELALHREAALDIVESNLIELFIDYKRVWHRELVLVFWDVVEDQSEWAALLSLRWLLHFVFNN